MWSLRLSTNVTSDQIFEIVSALTTYYCLTVKAAIRYTHRGVDWHRYVVVITTAQLYSTKPELAMERISGNGPGLK